MNVRLLYFRILSAKPLVETVSKSSIQLLLSKQSCLTSKAFFHWSICFLSNYPEREAAKVEGFEAGVQKPSYYVRLGSLSSKFRARAYQQALNKVRDAKQKSQETISQLHNTVSLIEYARKNMNSANQKLLGAQEKLYQSWVEWKKNTGQSDGDESHSAEHIESRTLAIAQSLTQQLQTTCLTLVTSIQGLPQSVQDQVYSVRSMAGDVYETFRSASSFRELSDSFLTTSKGQLKKMKESLDDVMDYLVNNTPLNWLVGPFYPQLPSTQHAENEGEGEKNSSQEDKQLEHNTE
uniref:Perilipin n=1 Tax=Pavo cristatus TaxID=9049 RepID=A0A8C9FZK7_PAVCR